MTSADQLERVREHARQAMREQIERRRAAGVPLFTAEQVGVLHQQVRERHRPTAAA